MPRKKKPKKNIRRNTLDNIYRAQDKRKPHRESLKLQPLYKTPTYKNILRPISQQIIHKKRIIKKQLQQLKIIQRPLRKKPTRSNDIKRAVASHVPLNTSVKRIKPYTRSMTCEEKYKNANRTRRNNFFKSKARGNTSARPEHNRRHIKC